MAISKVTSGGIADGTLSVEDIADDAVTAAKLANSINTDIATGVTGNTTANAALPKAGGTMTGALNIQSADNALAFFKSTDANANIKFSDSNSSDINQVGVGAIGNNLTLIAGGDNRLSIDSTGAVTMPAQPAFLVRNSTQNNIAVNTVTTLNFSNEIFDQNADFNPSNYTFTAPVTGKYQLNLVTYLNGIDTSASYIQVRIVTSNRHIQNIIDPNFASDLSYYSESLAALFDMDAGDTAFVEVFQSGGSTQLDAQAVCYFSGYLAC